MTISSGARAERGAVLIQTVLMLTVLGGCCAMVLDYGVLWVSRGQIQAAADAGALAGATVEAFDDMFDDSGMVEGAAQAMVTQNPVWGATALSEVDIPDPDHDPCQIAGMPVAPPRSYTCVRVRAYRSQDHGNALPTFFGPLIGVTSQGVKASSTAVAVPANTTDCVWPLAIPDKWDEHSSPGNNTFDKYQPTGPPALLPIPDVYVAPTASTPGSGYSVNFSTLSTNISLTLTQASMSPWQPIQRGTYVPVRINRLDAGGFAASVATCNQTPVTIGTTLSVEPTATFTAASIGAATRFAEDAGASWNVGTQRVQNSCAGDPSPCAPISPRRVVLPMFNTDLYENTRWPIGSTPTIRIVNFVGFFITSVSGSQITGYLTTYPGRVTPGQPMVGYISGFLRTALLYR